MTSWLGHGYSNTAGRAYPREPHAEAITTLRFPPSLDSNSVIQNSDESRRRARALIYPEHQGAVDAFYRDIEGEDILRVLPVSQAVRTRGGMVLKLQKMEKFIRPQLQDWIRMERMGRAHADRPAWEVGGEEYRFLKDNPTQSDLDVLLEYLSRTAEKSPARFVSAAKSLFRAYMSMCEHTHLWKSVRTGPDGELHTSPLRNRFQSNRNYQELRDALFDLSPATKAVFLTLTYDRKIVPSLTDALLMLNEDWNRFLSRLRAELGPLPPYLMTLEFQRDGYPHIHALFFGIEYLFENGTHSMYADATKKRSSVKSIESFWKKGYSYINRTKRGATVHSPVAYMMKYISKEWGWGRGSEESTLNHAMLWITGKRCFNTSRSLMNFLKANSERPVQSRIDDSSDTDAELECLIVSRPRPAELEHEPRPSGVVHANLRKPGRRSLPVTVHAERGEKVRIWKQKAKRQTVCSHTQIICVPCVDTKRKTLAGPANTRPDSVISLTNGGSGNDSIEHAERDHADGGPHGRTGDRLHGRADGHAVVHPVQAVGPPTLRVRGRAVRHGRVRISRRFGPGS